MSNFFKLYLSITENQVLQAIVRQACCTHLSKEIESHGVKSRDYGVTREKAARIENPETRKALLSTVPEAPSLGKSTQRAISVMDTYVSLTEGLRAAERAGSKVVEIDSDRFEALYGVFCKDWSRHDGSPEAMALVAGFEACKIGLSAAFEASRMRLEKEKLTPNVFTTGRSAVN